MTATAKAEAASRVLAGDDRTTYDNLSVALHWATAVLVAANFLLALTWGSFPRPTRHLMVVAHMSFGILLSAVILLRIVWRLVPGHQMPPAGAGPLELAAKGVHYLLYVMLAAEAVLGFVLRWSGGEAMSFFGVPIPSPMATVDRPTHRLIGDIHQWNGYAIVALAAGHAAAGLFHYYVLRDRVLTRMLPALTPRVR